MTKFPTTVTKEENICEQCSKRFKTKPNLKRHEKTHQNTQKKCKMCNVTFSNIEEYEVHIQDVHNGQSSYYFMCSECARQCKTKAELTVHIASKCGTIKLFKCKVCDKELMSAGSLHNHMLRHKGEPSYMCRFCAKLFLTSGQLKVHERKHTQERAFVCEVCGKGFCHRQSLITHSTLHTGIKPFTCENCGNSFSCIGNLLKHRKTHAECAHIPLTTHLVQNLSTKLKIKVNTPACAKLKSLQKKKELKAAKEKLPKDNNKHTVAVNVKPEELHFPLTTNDSLNSNGTTLQIEPKCVEQIRNVLIESEEAISSNVNYIQTSKYIIQLTVNHKYNNDIEDKFSESQRNEHTTKDNNSNNCTTNCVDNIFLKNDSQDDSDYQSNEANNDEECRNSGSEDDVADGKLNDNLQKIAKHAHKENIQCKYCQKSYSSRVWLLKHEKQHSLKKLGTYKCSCCKLDFNARDECFEHQRKEHSKLLTCTECDKVYANSTSLKAHEKYFHAGISKKSYTYICEKCGKQFPQKTELLIHKNHNCGEPPKLECEVCDKKFNTNWGRVSHMKVHLDKKYLCKFCGKKFHRKGQLKIHERSHTGEKPFACLYCPKAFAYRDSLITHSSLHTGIKPHLCEACGSRFSCLGNLIKHRTTHATTCGIWYSKNKDVNT